MIEIFISHKCTKCFPEKKTSDHYESGWMQECIITNPKRMVQKIYCENCGQYLGDIHIK